MLKDMEEKQKVEASDRDNERKKHQEDLELKSQLGNQRLLEEKQEREQEKKMLLKEQDKRE